MGKLQIFKTGTFAKHKPTGLLCFILSQTTYEYHLLWPTNKNWWNKVEFKNAFEKTPEYFSIHKGLTAEFDKSLTFKWAPRLDNLTYLELCNKWKNHKHFHG